MALDEAENAGDAAHRRGFPTKYKAARASRKLAIPFGLGIKKALASLSPARAFGATIMSILPQQALLGNNNANDDALLCYLIHDSVAFAGKVKDARGEKQVFCGSAVKKDLSVGR